MPTPHSCAQPEKYLSISSAGNRSMPAGTGVWVVKMVPARVASTASAKERPFWVIELAHPFQAEEPGVAFVGMENLRAVRPVPPGRAPRRCRAGSPGGGGARCRRRRAGR